MSTNSPTLAPKRDDPPIVKIAANNKTDLPSPAKRFKQMAGCFVLNREQ